MRIFQKGEWKLFWPLYLAYFFGIMVPDIDILIMIFFFAKGFTATEVGIGFGLMSLFVILAEIPTGAIADLFGKRASVQVHWLLHGITTAAFFFITAPWQMWVLFSIQGISATFASGAMEALPYEMAIQANRKDLIKEFYGKIHAIVRFSQSISYFLTLGFLYLVGSTTYYYFFGPRQGLDFLWFTSAAGFFIAFFIVFKIKEKVHREKFSLAGSIKDTYKTSLEAIRYSGQHPVVRKLFAASFFLVIAALFFSDIVYQPFLLDLGFKAENIALIVAIASIFGGIFCLIPKYIEKRFKTEKHYLQAFIILNLILLLLLFLFAGPIISIIFFLVYFNLKDLIYPVWMPFNQLFYKKEIRATIGSVSGVICSLAMVIFFPIVGICVDKFGANNTVYFAAIPLVIMFFILYSIKLKERIEH